MNQYLVSALDFTDEDAINRRLNARTSHFDTVRRLKEQKQFIAGGAILNNAGMMIGSSLIVQFETDLELSAWLAEEPYLLKKVWEKVDIKPFKVADV